MNVLWHHLMNEHEFYVRQYAARFGVAPSQAAWKLVDNAKMPTTPLVIPRVNGINFFTEEVSAD